MSAFYATIPLNSVCKRVRAWDIMVCNGCLAVNRDGVVPETYPHLAVHLDVRGIQPEKDAEGCILWPSN
jgi:hypothetical protein